MRVLHCPDIVGGNASQLARAERELGICSNSIIFQQNYLKYPVDQVLLPANATPLRKEVARWKLLWIALSYDVIHYNFGQSIMPSRLSLVGREMSKLPRLLRFMYWGYVRCFEFMDVRILKILGKVIVVTYQGDDARQGDYCKNNFQITFANEVGEDYYNPVTDQLKRERIKIFAKNADRIFSLNPDLLHILPPKATFLPYSHIDLRDWSVAKQNNPRPLIVHAPSNREVKGTRYIAEAINQLRTKGLDFEFILVEGMSNQEARKIYEKADLLVDQLLAGWYGGLAVELMALGKPVICYIREADLNYIPDEMRKELPIINATPSTISQVIEYWITDGLQFLPEIGQKSREYVERWHDPLEIAKKMKQEYEVALKEKQGGV